MKASRQTDHANAEGKLHSRREAMQNSFPLSSNASAPPRRIATSPRPRPPRTLAPHGGVPEEDQRRRRRRTRGGGGGGGTKEEAAALRELHPRTAPAPPWPPAAGLHEEREREGPGSSGRGRREASVAEERRQESSAARRISRKMQSTGRTPKQLDSAQRRWKSIRLLRRSNRRR
ncbi:hypothetical protein PVAP13_9KG027628 [Panicum virgatum]|uniref:Uncharacterized protein n=1 Tax=Panicum virgatum TaxID=38727 RepID=A0A8T0NDL7_PANVG|nr:hypothetical protein PVAP13_9KG027628 [Panicum virgatum]